MSNDRGFSTLREKKLAKVEAGLPLRPDEVKEMIQLHKKIVAALEEPKTVPDLALELEMTTPDVLWNVTALRKYGLIEDVGKQGDYRLYRKVS